MPRGPDGQYRPKGIIETAVTIGKIATKEIEDEKAAVKKALPRKKGSSVRASGKKRAKLLAVNRKPESP